MNKPIQIVNEKSGEVFDLPCSSREEILDSWLFVTSQIDLYTGAKNKLKKILPKFMDTDNKFDLGQYRFRLSFIQPMTYDKYALRQVFDDDTLDLFMKPAKTEIDKYIKEHLGELGEASTMLRKSMIPAGRPFTTVRLEKL